MFWRGRGHHTGFPPTCGRLGKLGIMWNQGLCCYLCCCVHSGCQSWTGVGLLLLWQYISCFPCGCAFVPCHPENSTTVAGGARSSCLSSGNRCSQHISSRCPVSMSCFHALCERHLGPSRCRGYLPNNIFCGSMHATSICPERLGLVGVACRSLH